VNETKFADWKWLVMLITALGLALTPLAVLLLGPLLSS
jgi:hypothetical protein